MMSVMKFALVVGLGLHLCTSAAARVPMISGDSRAVMDRYFTFIQQQELPQIVQLLVERAQRAERRGDTATAAELYDAIRDLGFVVVNRPGSGANPRQGEAPDRPRRWWEGRDDDDDHDDDGDDRDDDDDGDDDGGDSDCDSDGDGGDSDGGDSDGGGDD